MTTDWTMPQCVIASYTLTLKKFHGWIASVVFVVWTTTSRFHIFFNMIHFVHLKLRKDVLRIDIESFVENSRLP